MGVGACDAGYCALQHVVRIGASRREGAWRAQLTRCLPWCSFEVQVAAPQRWEQEYVRNTSVTTGPQELDVALFRLAHRRRAGSDEAPPGPQASPQPASVLALPPEAVPAVQNERGDSRADAAATSAHAPDTQMRDASTAGREDGGGKSVAAPSAGASHADDATEAPGKSEALGKSKVQLGWADVGLGEERERRRAEEVLRLDAERKRKQHAQGAGLEGVRQGDAHARQEAGKSGDSLPIIVETLLRDETPLRDDALADTRPAAAFAGKPLLNERWRAGKRHLHETLATNAADSQGGKDGGKEEGKCKALGERDALAAAAQKQWRVEEVASCIQAFPKYCDVSCAAGSCECRWHLSSPASSIASATSLGSTHRPEHRKRRGALD